MSVNTMSKQQAYALINAIHQEATGQVSIQPTDLSSFISVAQATLQSGYENTLNAITQVLQRTIIAVRPYDEKFKGLQMSADSWGGIIRKINFADRESIADPTHETVEGQSIDQYTVRKPKVIETRYVGSDVYMGSYTIYKEQLKTAFENEANFGSFITGLMTHFANERKQWLENLKRSLLANTIAAKADINDADSNIHLLTEYKTLTGLSDLTAITVMQPANYKPFMQWVYSRVSEISRLMSERSELFQQKLTGYPIMRHTDVRDQRVYISAKFLDSMDAMVLADTYHDNFLRYADVEAVTYWQAIRNPLQVSATPVYINASGAVTTGEAQVLSNVIGIMFDRDAMGYNIYNDVIETSPYNAKGQYYNMFAHMDIQLQNDLTEKAVVLYLD